MNRAATRNLLSALALALVSGCSKELVCTTSETLCGGQCVNLAADTSNCGSCGHLCGSGFTCENALCCEGDQCPAAILLACFTSNEVQGATADLVAVGTAAQLKGSGPISLAWSGSSLWAATSLSNTVEELGVGLGGVSWVSKVNVPVASSPDLIYLAPSNGTLYVSDDDASSVVLVDPASLAISGGWELPPFAFPQGMAFVGGRVYVALNGLGELAVFEPATTTVPTFIDLSSLGSKPGSSMPSRMALNATGSRLYVTLWNLDPTTYSPAGNGRLAVVDTSTDTLVPVASPGSSSTPYLDLGSGCQDPFGIALYGQTLYVTCGWPNFGPNGSVTSVAGAGVVPVDISGSTPLVGAVIATAALTNGPFFLPGAVVFCGNAGYVADQEYGYVARLDPTAGTLIESARPLCSPPAQPGGGVSYVADIACGR